MTLTTPQIKYLRSLAQSRKPVVTVGAAGLTEAVFVEIRAALRSHVYGTNNSWQAAKRSANGLAR